MAGTDNGKPLAKISELFKELAATVNSEAADVELAAFSRACSHVSPLFGCLGIAFKFAEMDYVAKVDDLAEASKSILTLQSVIDRDIEGNCVRKAGSHTRNLLRVKRGLDMVRVLFEQILAAEYVYHHGKFLKGSSIQGLRTSICSPSWMGYKKSCCRWDVCPSHEGTIT
ncbi:hypothetical protein CICLE_v10016636mg [Citrus x clementina]|uniref:Glycolipid transfer protein domain-containing protein n=1 Tax=Citrus clementina TaxID=85681 RepID=V4W7M3_CITCL|nr:hypothetical protein CICLE_v10016636mg [Citrus x clementina]